MDQQNAYRSIQVVYEAEPKEHGIAAQALPELRRDFLRQLLMTLLHSSDDLDAFALDYFPTVYRIFAGGMPRNQRESLLLERAAPHALYDALRTAFNSQVPPPPPISAPEACENPYRGLLVFGVRDAPLFFGRQKKVAELRRMLESATQPASDSGPQAPRLVAVIGPSGSGKSSLVQAGLLADLGYRPPSAVSYVAGVFRPQGRPLLTLAQLLLRLRAPNREWSLAEVDSFSTRLQTGGRALGDLIALVLADRSHRLLLVVDQLEELYTMADSKDADHAERKTFVDTLLTAASESGGRLDVVVTLRSDLLGETAQDPALQKALMTSGRALLVGALEQDELTEVITGPAARAGRPLPADAVALLVSEAAGQAGALPLLQFTLRQLWEAQTAAPESTIAELLRTLGGVGGSLAQQAEALYLGLNLASAPPTGEPTANAAQVRLRRAFVRLLQTHQGQVLGRRRPRLADLAGEGEQLGDVRATLARFIDARLLVVDGEGEDAIVEIGHESLGKHWDRLARWLREAEEHLPLLQRLSEETRRWQQQRRPSWLLWRGDELIELRLALPMLEGRGSLGSGERSFAQACITAAERRRVAGAAGLAALVAVLLGVSTLAGYAIKQAMLAEERLGQAVAVADKVVFQVDQQLERVPGTAEIRKSLLGNAIEMLNSIHKHTDGVQDPTLLRTLGAGYIQRGRVAMTHDDLTRAQQEFTKALEIDEILARRQPNDRQAQRDVSISLEKLGDIALRRGELAAAKARYAHSLDLREKLVQAGPWDAQAQRDLSIILKDLGDVALRTDELADAKVRYERALGLSEKLAQANPQDNQVQRDLSISLEKLGDVATKRGELAAAKAHYERSLALSEKLAQANPQGIQAQRDLSISIDRLGDAAVKRGELAAAKAHYERSLALSEKLAHADPEDTQAQRDLSISLDRLGDIAAKRDELAEAKAYYERSLDCRAKLARTDPHDAQAQRDLSISLEKLGDVATKQGELAVAKAHYERSLDARERLAQAGPHDVQAQRDLSNILEKLGDVAVQRNELAAAKAHYERSLGVRERLVQADPHDVQAQHDLSVSIERLGDVAVQGRELAEAKACYRRALDFREKLALTDPYDAQLQRNLSISLNKLGDVAVLADELAEAKAFYERAVSLREKLAQARLDDAQAQRELSVSLSRTASVAIRQEHLDEAQALVVRSLAVDERLAKSNPHSIGMQQDLLSDHLQLADLLQRRGQRAATHEQARTAAALLEKLRMRLSSANVGELDKMIRTLLR